MWRSTWREAITPRSSAQPAAAPSLQMTSRSDALDNDLRPESGVLAPAATLPHPERPRMRATKAFTPLLCLACLGAGGPATAAPHGDTQRITVRLQGAPAEAQIFAERVGHETVQLVDNSSALLEAHFDAQPSRTAHLRLVEGGPDGELLWDGLALLSDGVHTHIAFSYVVEGEQHRAARVATCPAPTPVGGSEPLGPHLLALGWGGLVLGYLGFLVLGWRVRGRGQGAP